MSADSVLAMIEAALDDPAVSPDAMRSAPNTSEPTDHFDGQLDWLPAHERIPLESLITYLGEAIHNGFSASWAVVDETREAFERALNPLVSYEPAWPPPWVPHTGEPAITMEAPDV